jgi:hypothetical protein
MDLRVFYQKIKQVEQSIERAHVVVVSHETSDEAWHEWAVTQRTS